MTGTFENVKNMLQKTKKNTTTKKRKKNENKAKKNEKKKWKKSEKNEKGANTISLPFVFFFFFQI